MNSTPYTKEIQLDYSYDKVYKYIISITESIQEYKLISESKTLNRYTLSYQDGLKIEINLETISDNKTKVKMLCLAGKKYAGAEQTTINLISDFEKAIEASIEGTLSEFKSSDPISGDTGGCISFIILIAAIGLITLGVVSFLS